MTKLTPAFLTGSRAYGKPKETSDIDIVMLVTEDAFTEMSRYAHPVDTGDPSYGEMQSMTLYMHDPQIPNSPRMNLIVVTDKGLYDVWMEGTKKLKKKAPVSRNLAVRLLTRMRDAYNSTKGEKK